MCDVAKDVQLFLDVLVYMTKKYSQNFSLIQKWVHALCSRLAIHIQILCSAVYVLCLVFANSRLAEHL